MGADEASTLAALQAHRRELIDPEIERHDRRLVKLMGDGALVEFASIVQATECAVAIQRAMAGRNADMPADRRIDLRIGLNLGDIIIAGDEIYGDGVNVAARLEGLAEPGGICLSESVRTAVGTKLPMAYAFLGEREVKNIAEPVPGGHGHGTKLPLSGHGAVQCRRRALLLLPLMNSYLWPVDASQRVPWASASSRSSRFGRCC